MVRLFLYPGQEFVIFVIILGGYSRGLKKLIWILKESQNLYLIYLRSLPWTVRFISEKALL